MNFSWKRSAIIALSVCGLSAQGGCSTTSSTAPTVRRTPPPACLTDCDSLPRLLGAQDRDVKAWAARAAGAYGECRSKHAECVEWVKRANQQEEAQ